MIRRQSRPAAPILAVLLLIGLAAGLSSCSRKLGWGVVLWSSAEGPLPAGTIVPVYIKSNIENLYVVGVPGSDTKVELPLWQVELFSSKAKARERVAELGANQHLYMVAARDGLPLRKEAANNSKRVYRLREGESVKVLEKVRGEAVSTGGETLPGDWYLVLAEGGERGYVFSYAMRLYDETKEGPPALASAKAVSGQVDLVFSRSWRPSYFQEMIDDQHVDLDLFSLRFGFFSDAIRRQIRIELPGVSEVFNYSAISEEGGAFVFADTPLRVKLVGEGRMDVSWTASPLEDEEEAGEPAAPLDASSGRQGFSGRASFVVLSVEPREVIQDEELRMQKLLGAFVDATGGSWTLATGGSAGMLKITKSRRFTWSDRVALPEGFLPEDAGVAGDALFRLHVDPALAASWEGAFTLRFDPPPAGGDQVDVDLLYRRTENGIVLARARLGEGVLGSGGAPGVVVVGTDSRFEPVVFVKTK
jgi:hypothetical protein